MEIEGAETAREGNSFNKFALQVVREQPERRKVRERSNVMPSITSTPPATPVPIPGWDMGRKGNGNTRGREDHSQVSVQQKAGGNEDKYIGREPVLEK